MPFLSNSFYFLRNRGQGYLPKGREDEGTIQSDCSSLPPSRTICVGSSILSLKLPSHSQELFRYILLDYVGSDSLNIKCHEWNYARQKGVTEGDNGACQEKKSRNYPIIKLLFSWNDEIFLYRMAFRTIQHHCFCLFLYSYWTSGVSAMSYREFCHKIKGPSSKYLWICRFF